MRERTGSSVVSEHRAADGTAAFQWWVPTRVWFGEGVTNRLPELLAQRWAACERILLVTGQGTLERTGLRAQLQTWCGRRTVTETQVAALPDLDVVEAVLGQARQARSQLVIGFGGGSAVDVAKAAAVLSLQTTALETLLQGGATLQSDRLPCLAIPTTAGTGSEVTPWATIWNLRTKRKHSLGGPSVFPDAALVDPQWTHTMPPGLTAATGLDALTHAIEACWSTRRNPLSTALAREAIQLIVASLPAACAMPDDRSARTAMARASLIAGVAFSQTQTAAAHAMSYPMTARFGVPHGVACSISVPALLRLNGRATPAAVSPILEALGAGTVEAAAEALSQWMDALPIPRRLQAFGIMPGDLPELAREGGDPSRMSNNPYPLSRDEVQGILQEVW